MTSRYKPKMPRVAPVLRKRIMYTYGVSLSVVEPMGAHGRWRSCAGDAALGASLPAL